MPNPDIFRREQQSSGPNWWDDIVPFWLLAKREAPKHQGTPKGGRRKPNMSKAIRSLLEPHHKVPPNYTGIWRGVHYYCGAVWEGPTNKLGRA